MFLKFKLSDSQLETLHSYLLHFHNINQTNVLNKIEQGARDDIDINFAFMTCESFFDYTKNSVGIHPGHRDNDCHCFLLNEYYLYFSFGDLLVNGEVRFEDFSIKKNDPEVKVGWLSRLQWEAMESALLSLIVRTSMSKIIEKGEVEQVMQRLNRKYPNTSS